MALNNLGLGFVFTARDLASGTISNLERNFLSLDKRVGLGAERIQTAFRQVGFGLTVFSAGAITLGASLSLANAAGQFEQSIAAVGAVSGASSAELGLLRDAAIDAGIATQFSPTEATLGLRELAAAGFNARESIDLLLPVLDLAGGSLGELTPEAAAGLAAQAMKAFGIASSDASLAVDQMLQSVNLFALNAKELPLALGTASRGAQSLNQSLSETLIALGLVKNVIPGVERASTAVAVAMERMADPKIQQKLKGLGVQVVDTQGQFRAFLDIVGDLAPQLDKMTASQRSAFLLQTFGSEALAGVNAVLTQVTNGIRTETGEVVRGADAIKSLRDSFEGAGGTAKKFREQMLDTFEGQKKLLSGSLETLAIVAGEPFAQVFKPVVGVVVDIVNALLSVFRALPAPVKRAFATFVVGAGTVLTFVGAAIAAKGILALTAIALQALGVTFGGLVATILPAIAIVGVLAVTVAGFVRAFQENVGGLGDFARNAFERLRLVFQGLVQLFSQGGFSGAVRDELNSGNQELKNFLINVFLWVNRIKNFFAGVSTGFADGVEIARPTIEAFVASLQRLGAAFGVLSARDDAGTAAAKFRTFGSSGESVGKTLARVFDFVVQVFTALVDVANGVAQAWVVIRPAVDAVEDSMLQLGSTLGTAITQLSGTTDATRQNGDAWTALGNVIGLVVGVVVGMIGVLVTTVSVAVSIASGAIHLVMDAFSGLADVVAGVVFLIGSIVNGSWADVWTGMKLIAFGVIQAIAGAMLELAGTIGGVVDSIAAVFGKVTEFQKTVGEAKVGFLGDVAKGFGVQDLTFSAVGRAAPTAAPGPGPAVAPALPAAAAVAALTAPQLFTPAVPNQQSAPQGPFVANLIVDGEPLARASFRAERDAASRAFSPVAQF